jgi:hypothetical protein
MATTTTTPHHAHGGAVMPFLEKPNLWFDYELQTWVKHDIVQPCGHKLAGWTGYCCNQNRYAYMFIWEARRQHGLCGCDACCSAEWQKQVI